MIFSHSRSWGPAFGWLSQAASLRHSSAVRFRKRDKLSGLQADSFFGISDLVKQTGQIVPFLFF
jgi:hypothetical protein